MEGEAGWPLTLQATARTPSRSPGGEQLELVQDAGKFLRPLRQS